MGMNNQILRDIRLTFTRNTFCDYRDDSIPENVYKDHPTPLQIDDNDDEQNQQNPVTQVLQNPFLKNSQNLEIPSKAQIPQLTTPNSQLKTTMKHDKFKEEMESKIQEHIFNRQSKSRMFKSGKHLGMQPRSLSIFQNSGLPIESKMVKSSKDLNKSGNKSYYHIDNGGVNGRVIVSYTLVIL